MAITDKTRKILWGPSGNRCVICKHELVVDATKSDDESVVADECHIASGKSGGPRYDPSFPKEKLDLYENLILLCRVHHKMIDDQQETYSVDILRQMKSNHEVWVSQSLTESPRVKPIKIKRIKQNIPTYLTRLTSGKEVLNIIECTQAISFDNDELLSEQEVAFVGSFFQIIRDWGDLFLELEPSDRLRVSYDLTHSLQELEEAGFYAFGGREVQVLEGAIDGPSDWNVALLEVLRISNKDIVLLGQEELEKKHDQQSARHDK